MENNKKIQAYISEDMPTLKRGDSQSIEINGEPKDIVIREVYVRVLEDITFSDLKMIRTPNPNLFIKEWEKSHGSFDKNRKVWVIAYVEKEERK